MPRWGFIVTNLNYPAREATRFYNGWGTAEQWIKEGKQVLKWTRLSCHRFVANQVHLALFVLAYNLGNFLQRLALPHTVRDWSLRSVQVGLEPHPAPLAPTAWELEAARRREEVLRLHHQGLPAGEIAQWMEVTPVTVYRILGEEGLRPNPAPEAERARERREEAIRLHQEGVSGAEIARCLDISEPAVAALTDGQKVVVAIQSGYRESTESWSVLLRDLKARGMGNPCLVVGDGHLGISLQPGGQALPVGPCTREAQTTRY